MVLSQTVVCSSLRAYRPGLPCPSKTQDDFGLIWGGTDSKNYRRTVAKRAPRVETPEEDHCPSMLHNASSLPSPDARPEPGTHYDPHFIEGLPKRGPLVLETPMIGVVFS